MAAFHRRHSTRLAQHQDEATFGHLEGLPWMQSLTASSAGLDGIDFHLPSIDARSRRHADKQRLEMRVEKNQSWAVRPVDNHGEESRVGKAPVGLGHFFAIRAIPGDIFSTRRVPYLTLEKMVARQAVFATNLDEQSNEIRQIVFGDPFARPIDPTDFIVLAIDVVVAVLAIGEFVAR